MKRKLLEPERGNDGWISVRHPRREPPAPNLKSAETTSRRRLETPPAPSVSPPCSPPRQPRTDPGRYGALRKPPSLPSPSLPVVAAVDSRSIQAVPSSIGPACDPVVKERRGIPANWPARIPWRLPFYPTEEEWARAEMVAESEMRADGFVLSPLEVSSDEED